MAPSLPRARAPRGITRKRQEWCNVPFEGPCVRNLRAGQDSVNVTIALPEKDLDLSLTRVWQVPSMGVARGPGMRHAMRAGRLDAKMRRPDGKMRSPCLAGGACTRPTAFARRIAALSAGSRGNGTVIGPPYTTLWWLLAQADPTSTSNRIKAVALGAFIGLKDTTPHTRVSLRSRHPRRGQCSGMTPER